MSRWDPYEQRLVIDAGPGNPLGRGRRDDRAQLAEHYITRGDADQPRQTVTRPSTFNAGLDQSDRFDLAAVARRAMELGDRAIDVGAAIRAGLDQRAAERQHDGEGATRSMAPTGCCSSPRRSTPTTPPPPGSGPRRLRGVRRPPLRRR